MEFSFFRLSSHLLHVGILAASVSLFIMSPRPSIFCLSLLMILISNYNTNMEFESYDIDISHIKDSDKVCWEYTTEPSDDDEWQTSGSIFYKLSPTTEALAVASDYVHLDRLTPTNLIEWYYRLDSLFDAGVGFLFSETVEGEIPIRMTITDLKDHLGLRIKVRNWDNTKFDKSVRTLRMQNHLRELL